MRLASLVCAAICGIVGALDTAEEQIVTPVTNLEEVGEIDGVSNVYETMALFAYQKFFDSITQKIAPPLLADIDLIPPLPSVKLNNVTILPDDEFSIDELELEGFKFVNASVDQHPSIVTIRDQAGVAIGFNQLTFDVAGNYSFITDPPIFADIGEAHFHVSPTNFTTNVKSRFSRTSEGSNNALEFDDVQLNSTREPFADFDGISDFSQVVSGSLNTLIGVLRSRFESFINGHEVYGLDARLAAFINKVLGLIPDQIDLGNGLYIDGLLFSNIQAQNDLIQVPLMTQIRYENATYDASKCDENLHVVLGEGDWQSQFVLNDCTINELIYQLFSAKMLNITLKNEKLLTTTELALLLGRGITKSFGGGQPCSITVTPGGDAAPMITKNLDGYFIVDWDIDLDIKCVPSNSTTGEFIEAVILKTELIAEFDLKISYSVTVKAKKFKDLQLIYIGPDPEHTNIKLNPKSVIQFKFNLLAGAVEGIIETIFKAGISFDNIFYKTILCWLDIRQIWFDPKYDQHFLWVGLTIDYYTEQCPGQVPWGDWTTAPPKEQIGQIVSNIISRVRQRLDMPAVSALWQETLSVMLLPENELEMADEVFNQD